MSGIWHALLAGASVVITLFPFAMAVILIWGLWRLDHKQGGPN